MNLSIVIPAFNEKENLIKLIPEIRKIISEITNSYEIIVVDKGSADGTLELDLGLNTKIIKQKMPGYGGALREGFNLSKGEYIITMDADQSHEPLYVKDLWEKRNEADLIVASRYVSGGRADMPYIRKLLSIFLNELYTYVLSLPYKDISSGYRLYNANIVKAIHLTKSGFSMLQELLSKFHCEGYKIIEVPFSYKPRIHGESTVRLWRMASSYLVTLFEMWKLRNSLDSADYDERAYKSRILPQRYWQRKRYKIVTNMLKHKDNVLDIGCGTSKIIQSMPKAVGLDLNHRSLRYLNKKGNISVEGAIEELPFKNSIFETVICSQLIEHIPKENFKPEEIERVLKRKGIFILGTPDYEKKWWCFTEWVYKKLIPGGYGMQHITRYTSSEIENIFCKRGWKILDKKYVLGMEVIYKLQKAL
jgi:dolichol-phosphate mannosyltransferase